ncbi:Mur ligase [Pseudomassariella vexata]|uniref:Folylpolyglutamate synthase n=1 Tax=Pseudomassariella vexata TaxID=1141098 RepID=A0A1Y2D891_9PEZI|nr:Mur ligase [Pseudomassariella vexata]ORY54855.1 Mur ligase [Pseudomassariella vexata]
MKISWIKPTLICRKPAKNAATSYTGLFSLTRFRGRIRLSSTMARTYDSALSRLSSLQSNHAVTSLFSPPPTTSPNSSSNGKPQDLNALAIPEMLSWLCRAGMSPSDLTKLRCIHVAGTKGKGSVCAYLTSILTQPGLHATAGRVGTYTSPHLVSVRERIMLDGQPISQDLFTRYFFEVWDAFTASARALLAEGSEEGQMSAEVEGPMSKPFYFRFLTILAFYVFIKEGVKTAVIECGIGGEYDATNVLPVEATTASVVTQLGIDHVGMLGRTLPDIAWHKIGVAKEGRKCFSRRLGGEAGEAAMKVMRKRTQEKGAELVEVTDDEVESWGGVKADTLGSLDGDFQKFNQALAVAAAKAHMERLGESAIGATNALFAHLPDGFTNGLQQARLRGRCETRIDGNITWLIDGAHTAESLEEVAKWYSSKQETLAGSEKVLIFNQQDRDAAKLLAGLYDGILRATRTPDARPFDRAVFTRNDLQKRGDEEPDRDLSVQKSAADTFESLAPGTATRIHDNMSDVIQEVREQYMGDKAQGKKVVVLVTGSLHLVGALLRTLKPDAPI